MTVKKIPLKERLADFRGKEGLSFVRLCDLNLEDYLQAIELVAGEPRRPILPEAHKGRLRSYQREDSNTLASMAAMGAIIEGVTLRTQYLYDLLLYPILTLEDYL